MAPLWLFLSLFGPHRYFVDEKIACFYDAFRRRCELAACADGGTATPRDEHRLAAAPRNYLSRAFDDRNSGRAISCDTYQQLRSSDTNSRRWGYDLYPFFVHSAGDVMECARCQLDHRVAGVVIWIEDELVDDRCGVFAQRKAHAVYECDGQRAVFDCLENFVLDHRIERQ